jgi:hypothetical protein
MLHAVLNVKIMFSEILPAMKLSIFLQVFGKIDIRIYNFSSFKKSIIFWDMTLCSPLSVNRRFRGTYRLHLQGRRNKFSKKQASKQAGGRKSGFI